MHKFFSMCLFLFITLYMFRAHRAHHQEREIISIQPLVTVILCWWPRCGTHLGHQHRMTVTRGCIDTICLSLFIIIHMMVVPDEIRSVILCNVTNMSPSSDDMLILKQCISSERIASSVRGTYRLFSSSHCLLVGSYVRFQSGNMVFSV
jgi:hypothetical protein